MTTLLADVGGTNVRFCLLSGDRLSAPSISAVAAYPSLAAAAKDFLAHQGAAARPDTAVLAVAGPVEQGQCRLTNSGWIVDAASLKHELGLQVVDLMNDHEAIAWALPQLGAGDTLLVGPDAPVRGAPLAVIGAGTGLGMSCLLPGPGIRSVASEGGHATIAGGNEREDALLAIVRRRFGHVSAERILSGPGLVNLYLAIARLEGRRMPTRTPLQITRAASLGTCDVCEETVDTFCALLGGVAGNLALHFAARGGVYIAGGIAPQIVDKLALSSFRQRFDAKGRFHSYLAQIPVRVVLRANPALVGLKAFATWRQGTTL